jgi:hypothetical protein
MKVVCLRVFDSSKWILLFIISRERYDVLLYSIYCRYCRITASWFCVVDNTFLVQMLFVACQMNQLIQTVVARWRERTVNNLRIRKPQWSILYGRIAGPWPHHLHCSYVLSVFVNVCESTIMVSSKARQGTSLQNHSRNGYMHVW